MYFNFEAEVNNNKMRRIAKRLGTTILIAAAGITVPAHSQILSMDIIHGGVEDAQVILQEYLKPFANILGSDLNAVWYNTAKPH